MKNYDNFIESLARTDYDLKLIERSKSLEDDEFLDILNKNCKNFSFNNEKLWRSKSIKDGYLQLFTPNPRNADPLAFKDFFNKIENDKDYPVIRKNSLIGGTNKEICKTLVGAEMYLVIPFDNSEMIFCPICDLWALRDRNDGRNSNNIGGKMISKDNFIKVTYDKNFKIPLAELNVLPKSNTGAGGCEFFTSSPCLLIHESKIDWLKENI